MATQVFDQFFANGVDRLSDTWFLEHGEYCGICRADEVAEISAKSYSNGFMTTIVKTKLCGHVFHEACLHTWFYHQSRVSRTESAATHGMCTFCRSKLLSEPTRPVQAPDGAFHRIWAWLLLLAKSIFWILYLGLAVALVSKTLLESDTVACLTFVAMIILPCRGYLDKFSKSFPSCKIWVRLLYLMAIIYWALCLGITVGFIIDSFPEDPDLSWNKPV
jgi:hypothetical protein